MRKTHSHGVSYHLSPGLSLTTRSALKLSETSASHPFSGFDPDALRDTPLRTPQDRSLLASTSRVRHPLWSVTNARSPPTYKEFKNLRQEIMAPVLPSQSSGAEVVAQTNSLLRNRHFRKENMRDVLSRKREMLLIQLKINEKSQAIRHFDEKLTEKRVNLRKIEHRVVGDLNHFNAFLDADKDLMKATIREAEEETKERLQLNLRLKEMREFKTTNMNEALKLFEKLHSLYFFKQFLDKITPSTFAADPQPLLDSDQVLAKQQSMGRGRGVSLRAKTPTHSDSRINKSMLVFSGRKDSDVVERALRMVEATKTEVPEDLRQFIREPVTTCNMYFQRPSDLIEVYRQIEEENIKLITFGQNLRHKVEEKEQVLANMKRLYEGQKSSLSRTKEAWTHKTSQLHSYITSQQVHDGPEQTKIDRFIGEISAKVFRLSETLRIRHSDDVFAALTQIESLLSRDIGRIQGIEQKLLKRVERSINEDNKRMHVAEAQRRAVELSADKNRRLQLKGIKLHRGRKVNSRSHLKLSSATPQRPEMRSQDADSLTSTLD